MATSTVTSNPRCVVDTNVLISAALSPNGTPRRVVAWVIDHGRIVLSAPAFDELATRFIGRQKFDRYLGRDARRSYVAEIAMVAEAVHVTSRISVCSDPDDDAFIELAVDGQADYLITGNTKDFPGAYEGVQIVSPREFAVAARVPDFGSDR